MNLAETDTCHLLHPFTSIQDHERSGPHIIDRAEGIYVYDTAGKQYVDAMAGLWCVNVGYGRRELARVMAQQAEKLAFYHSFMSVANAPAIELSGQLARMAPGSLNRAFFCNSGSEANDTQIKMVWYYNNLRGKPKKKKIIARRGAYHGVTVASGSLSGLSHIHDGFDLPRERFVHVSRPDVYWEKAAGMSEHAYSRALAHELEQQILTEGPETVAAFISEPVMGAGGVIPPSEGYFDEIVPILKQYDILFIVDEVICGFGRLGKMFGSDLYNLKPDLMTIAKGLTSGYVPMSACLVSDEIYDVLRSGAPKMGPFAHGFTWTAHPVAAAVALKNLEILMAEGLVDNAAEVGAYFQAQLRKAVAAHPLVGDVRGVGMVAGIELVADKERKVAFELSDGVAKKLYMHALEQGLICRPLFNTVAFSPPLTLSKSDADEIIRRLKLALRALSKELGR